MKKLFLLAAALMALAACKKDDTGPGKQDSNPGTPVIEVTSSNPVELGYEAGTFSVDLSVQGGLELDGLGATIRQEGEWLSYTGAESGSSAGTAVMSFSYSANEVQEAREATVTISYPNADPATVTVSQKGKTEEGGGEGAVDEGVGGGDGAAFGGGDVALGGGGAGIPAGADAVVGVLLAGGGEGLLVFVRGLGDKAEGGAVAGVVFGSEAGEGHGGQEAGGGGGDGAGGAPAALRLAEGGGQGLQDAILPANGEGVGEGGGSEGEEGEGGSFHMGSPIVARHRAA